MQERRELNQRLLSSAKAAAHKEPNQTLQDGDEQGYQEAHRKEAQHLKQIDGIEGRKGVKGQGSGVE